jgi:hypothetical protein
MKWNQENDMSYCLKEQESCSLDEYDFRDKNNENIQNEPRMKCFNEIKRSRIFAYVKK